MISGRNLPIGIGIAVQKGRSFPISYLPLLKIGFLDNSKPRVTGGRKATGLTELAGLPKGDHDAARDC